MSAWLRLVRLRPGVRPFALRWSVSALAVSVACSAAAPGERDSEHESLEEDLAEVVYQGKVTDEALVGLLDRVPQPESQPQVSVCVPEAGASLTAQAPIEFSFATSSCALGPEASAKLRSTR